MDEVRLTAVFVEKNGSKIELMGYKCRKEEGCGERDLNPRITAETDLESVAFDRLATSAWGVSELS